MPPNINAAGDIPHTDPQPFQEARFRKVACKSKFCSRSRFKMPIPQAPAWRPINANGSEPSRRYSHVAAWANAADGMYVHGGEAVSVGAQEVRRVGTGDLRRL